MLNEEEKLEIYKKLTRTEKNWVRSLEITIQCLYYAIAIAVGVIGMLLYINFEVTSGDGAFETKSFICAKNLEDVD